MRPLSRNRKARCIRMASPEDDGLENLPIPKLILPEGAMSPLQASPVNDVSSGSSSDVIKTPAGDEQHAKDARIAGPTYTADFFDEIYRYHHSRGYSSVRHAHDIGTGPGEVAVQLASRFDHITASDAELTYLMAARDLMARAKVSSKATFIQSTGEDIGVHARPRSTDLIAAAQSLLFMEPKPAIAAWAGILRPGGTLAIWWYGRPLFTEEPFAASCQKIYNKLLNRVFSKAIDQEWERATVSMESWLDDIELPSDQWEHVRRHKWNTSAKLSFYDAEACDLDVQRASRVGPEEQVVEEKEKTAFWAEEWDIEDFRRFTKVTLSDFTDDTDDIFDEKVERMYRHLEKVMGGHGAKRKITWPAVLIMAKRK